jgi:hypothetical protein
MRLPRRMSGELLVLVVALVPRLDLVLRHGGLRGTYGYDASVYYAAADALVHGRLPYRDYVLLHPPGIALAASPFAWFGELTSDDSGFVAANLACTLLGALNAVLIVRIAQRLGLSRGAALVGGLCYAAWWGAIDAEYLLRLEPIGNFCLLCGLLGYARATPHPRARWAVLAGAGFGAAAAVKIWYAAPLALMLVWQAWPSRRNQLPRFVTGAAAALVLIDGPFFVLAPRQMWSMVVSEQLGRGQMSGLPTRLVGLTGVRLLSGGVSGAAAVAVIAAEAACLLALCYLATRLPAGRLPAALLLVEIAVLVLSPSWFGFYDDYAAPGLSLTVAASAAWLARAAPTGRLVAAAVPALTAASLAGVLFIARGETVPYPSSPLAEAVEHTRCVMADTPMPLIELDALSRDLANGCPDWVDVTGRTYGPDAAWLPDGRSVPRARNARWQRDLTHYLLSGNAVTIFRAAGTGIGSRLTQVLRREPVLASVDGFTVFRTRRSR